MLKTKNINFQNDEVDEMLRNLFATSGDNSEDIAKMAEKSGSLYATLAQDRMGELVANDVGSSIEVESSIASDGAIVAPRVPKTPCDRPGLSTLVVRMRSHSFWPTRKRAPVNS